MQIYATPPTERPKRSISYNDLKKKRLMRSQSQKKLGSKHFDQSTVKKQRMSEVKSMIAALPQDERVVQACINELKEVLGVMRKRSSKKRIISVKQSLTERSSIRQAIENSQNKFRPMWDNGLQGGDTKQLIKNILNKNKSQRRLVKFNEIRDKFKREKEKSLSNDKQQKATLIKSPKDRLKDRTIYNTKDHQNSGKDIQNKCTQPLPNKDQLQNSQEPQLLQNILQIQIIEKSEGKQNKSINIQLEGIDISSIKNQSIQMDESEVKELNALASTELQDFSQIQGSFMKLLKADGEKSNGCRAKQVRRKGELDRMKRVFPLGFFGN